FSKLPLLHIDRAKVVVNRRQPGRNFQNLFVPRSRFGQISRNLSATSLCVEFLNALVRGRGLRLPLSKSSGRARDGANGHDKKETAQQFHEVVILTEITAQISANDSPRGFLIRYVLRARLFDTPKERHANTKECFTDSTIQRV